MEDKQFEDLTKAMANGQSRRRIIKIVAGGVLSGVAGLFGGRRGGSEPALATTYTTTTTKAPRTTTTTTKAPRTTTTTTKAPRTTTTTTTTARANCFHSSGPNGGCKGACTSAGFTGNQCNRICGNGQFTGACPVGQGGGNPCCNPGYCNPANFTAGANGPVYTGPRSGC
jgi:hypothetical protein